MPIMEPMRIETGSQNLSRTPGLLAYAVQHYPETPVQPVDRVRERREHPSLQAPSLYHKGINRAQAPAASAGRFIDLLA